MFEHASPAFNLVRRHFVELDQFGLNGITVTFVFTTIFGLLGSWGLYKQIQMVKKRGGQSVSVIWSISFMFMFASYYPYGLSAGKLAILMQSFLRVPFYLILLPLLYRANVGFSKKEWTLVIALTTSLIVSYWDIGKVFLGLSWLGAIIAADQPYKIWKNRTRGSVSIELMASFEASIIFWLAYAFVTHDGYIKAWAVVYFTVYTTTIIFYYLPRHRT